MLGGWDFIYIYPLLRQNTSKRTNVKYTLFGVLGGALIYVYIYTRIFMCIFIMRYTHNTTGERCTIIN